MDYKKLSVLPNHKEIGSLVNELYNKQDEFNLSNPYELCYLIINKLGYRKQSDTAKEIIKWIKLNGLLEYGGYVIHDSTIEQICKKYGVDLGE